MTDTRLKFNWRLIGVSALTLTLAACNSSTDRSIGATNQLVGGSAGVCSSAFQGSCEDWDAYWDQRVADHPELADVTVALAASEPVELSEQKIDTLLADSAWDADPDFRDGAEIILNHLRDELLADGDAIYDDWQDFRNAFIAVTDADTTEDLPDGVDGDAVWFDSSSAQYATFEGLRKADERLNYTVTSAKAADVQHMVDNLPADTLDDDQKALTDVIDDIVDNAETRNQDELIAAISAASLDGEVLADGDDLWNTMDLNDWYDILLYITSESEDPGSNPPAPFRVDQDNIDAIEAANWFNEEEGEGTVLVLQHMLDENDGDPLVYDERDDFRDAFSAVLLNDGFDNGGQLWNSLPAVVRYKTLELLIDPLTDFERAREFASLSDSTNQDSVAIYESFVELARKTGDTDTPRVLVMTSSGANSYAAADYYVDLFNLAGADAEWLPLDRAYRQARDSSSCDWLGAQHASLASAAHLDLLFPDYFDAHKTACENGLADMIAEADGIFINGGDQVRTFDALVTYDESGQRVESDELKRILERHAEGDLVIGGTSAGAAVQGGGKLNDGDTQTIPMIRQGSPHNLLVNGYTDNTAQFDGGMGVFRWGVTDTHFSERARETRLIQMVQQAEVRFGFGVDETTALDTVKETVNGEPRVTMTVVGAGGVYIVDVAGAQTIVDAPLDIRDVTTHYLQEGDRFIWHPDSESYDIEFAGNTSNIDNIWWPGSNNSKAVTNDDILYQTNYRDTAIEMLTSGAIEAVSTSYEDDPTYKVTLRVNAQTNAAEGSDRVRYSHVLVDVAPQ
ncbi:MAG: cyanophycinase [Natronospirillum sp.]|uniref:cyanophycinase n=1 Tax=Natronospirillum sp. TaxID=2812955 RepID=UPI0025E08120|nr:cyanophycinase [Natronospirillum sp.]MCH8553195.1 cyanophycinase [Natronospirillum sp.]